jgi:hypothetical protein
MKKKKDFGLFYFYSLHGALGAKGVAPRALATHRLFSYFIFIVVYFYDAYSSSQSLAFNAPLFELAPWVICIFSFVRFFPFPGKKKKKFFLFILFKNKKFTLRPYLFIPSHMMPVYYTIERFGFVFVLFFK